MLAERCVDADLDADGIVNADDTQIATAMLGKAPGPSGMTAGRPRIVIASVSGAQGVVTELPVTLKTNGAEVAGIQNDIAFSPQAPIAADTRGQPDCTVNPALGKPASVFAFQPAGCSPGVDCTAVRAIIVGTGGSDEIADGAELYRCKLDVPPETPVGAYALACLNGEGGDSEGNLVPVDCPDAEVSVGPAPPACTGDCGRDRRVAIGELIRGVNIALGLQPVSSCTQFDLNDDGSVSISELIKAVNHALNGCPT